MQQLVDKKILIAIPCHRRTSILDIQCFYHCHFLMPMLRKEKMNIDVLYIGTDDVERDVIEKYGDCFKYENQEKNILTHKFNRCFSYGLDYNYDFVITLGSDDLIPIPLLIRLIHDANQNGFMSSLNQMLLCEVDSLNVYEWIGYSKKLSIVGIGAGRVYSKGLLSKLKKDPFGQKNSFATESVLRPFLEEVLETNYHIHKQYILYDDEMQMLCLKVDQTISKMKMYKERKLHKKTILDLDNTLLTWMPNEIKEKIKKMKIEKEQN